MSAQSAPRSARAAVPQDHGGGHRVELSWKDFNINRRIRVDHFNVYRAPAKKDGGKLSCSDDWTKVGSAPTPVMHYSDTTVAAGQDYCYAVTAVNAKGESSKSVVAVASVPAP